VIGVRIEPSSTLRNTILRLLVFILFVAASAGAQSPPLASPTDQQTPPPELKLDTVTVPITPDRRQFGIFTLEPPVTNGQIVGVGVPIGELVGRAVGSVKKAQHRRAERKARVQVQKELQEFLAQQGGGVNAVIKN
jgi:hypothetical protein